MDNIEILRQVLILITAIIPLVTAILQFMLFKKKNVSNDANDNAEKYKVAIIGGKDNYYDIGDKTYTNTTHITVSASNTVSSDNTSLFAILIFAMLPLMLVFWNKYWFISTLILLLLSGILCFYNYSKAKRNPSIFNSRDYFIHYTICICTLLLPALSCTTIFSPMSISKLVDELLDQNFITYFIHNPRPILYYISKIGGTLISAIFILKNIFISKKFYKSRYDTDLYIKQRIMILLICFLIISGLLYVFIFFDIK